MQIPYLTKSDFKLAQTCPTKLYYRKKGYPTVTEGEDYLNHLADEGYLVEALARAYFQDGKWIGYSDDVESAAWNTMSAMSESCTLFEATFISGGKLARVDILIRRGNVIELIEIKSRGFNRQRNDEQIRNRKSNLFRSGKNSQEIRTEWRPYLEDAAFQTSILQEVFPHMKIVPYLLMPDTSQPCGLDGLHHQFTLLDTQSTGREGEVPSAEYAGDPRDIRRHSFLVRVDVTEEVRLLLPEVRQRATIYLSSLIPSLRRIDTSPSTNCHACEFRVSKGEMRGFHECWGAMAEVTPHLLDLYRIRDAGGRKAKVADNLIAAGQAGLLDFPEKKLGRNDGAMGEVAKRQSIQIVYSRLKREWISVELETILQTLPFPHYFVDFETCTPAIPRYKGMRPYETIAFQWSCQTLDHPASEPQSSEWLQEIDEFPNATFVNTLRRQLGVHGAVLVWSTHEATILSKVRRQLEERGEERSAAVEWIDDFLKSGRLIDMNRLTLKHYFHPRMGGRTSLKVVADAIWQESEYIRHRLPQYVRWEEDELVSLYDALPPLAIKGQEVSVAEGFGAIVAYYQMMERSLANATLEAEMWRQLLRQYCQLDTLAMVMVWWHWRRLMGQAEQDNR